MMVSKRNLLFQGLLFRFQVKFQGCTGEYREGCWWKTISQLVLPFMAKGRVVFEEHVIFSERWGCFLWSPGIFTQKNLQTHPDFTFTCWTKIWSSAFSWQLYSASTLDRDFLAGWFFATNKRMVHCDDSSQLTPGDVQFQEGSLDVSKATTARVLFLESQFFLGFGPLCHRFIEGWMK